MNFSFSTIEFNAISQKYIEILGTFLASAINITLLAKYIFVIFPFSYHLIASLFYQYLASPWP